MHRAFGSAIAEADHVHGESSADLFGERVLRVVWHAEHRARLERGGDGVHDGRVAMAGHEGAEAHVEIDVLVAVDVADSGAIAVPDM